VNRLFRLAVAGLSLSLIAVSSIHIDVAHAKSFSNCSALNKAFQFGVAHSAKPVNKGRGPIEKPAGNPRVYSANKRLDTDKDGIACEVLAKPKANEQKSQPPLPPAKPVIADAYSHAAVDLEECRLKETENLVSLAGSKGFPAKSQIPYLGDVKFVMIPIDFSNATGTGNPKEMFSDDLTEISKWGKYFSRGKTNYQVSLASDNWLRAPKKAESYSCIDCKDGSITSSKKREAIFKDLVKFADPVVDFTDVDFVIFIFPEDALVKYKADVYSGAIDLVTEEGQIRSPGMAMWSFAADKSRIWDLVLHEALHFQGFIGHGPMNGSQWGIYPDQMGAYAIQAWEGFVASWYAEDEILCLDAGKLSQPARVTLSSIDNFGDGPEGLLVKLDHQTMVVIEYRKSGPYTNLRAAREFLTNSGLTAYRVEVNAPHYRKDGEINGDSKNFWSYIFEDGSVNIYKSVKFRNLKITRLADNQVEVELVSP
jgi:hypothetical protein